MRLPDSGCTMNHPNVLITRAHSASYLSDTWTSSSVLKFNPSGSTPTHPKGVRKISITSNLLQYMLPLLRRLDCYVGCSGIFARRLLPFFLWAYLINASIITPLEHLSHQVCQRSCLQPSNQVRPAPPPTQLY